jgi:hypothetical protein
MKKIYLSLLSLSAISLSYGQSLDWAKQFGGTGTETGTIVVTDSDRNVYTIGQFTAEIDVDPGVGVVTRTSTGNSDIYLTKLDSAGNYLWSAQFGGNQGDFSVSMTVDAFDNVICSGVFEGTVDFDPGTGVHTMTSTSSGESFIVKLDSDGNFQWSTQRSGFSGYDRNYGLKTDASGNIYTAGLFLYISDFDPGVGVQSLTSIGSYDIFVQKLDSNGNFQWVKQMGGPGADATAYALDLDDLGNIYITGYFTDTVDFNPSTAAADTMNIIADQNGDAFVVRLDNSGNYVWAVAFNGDSQTFGYDIVVDAAQNVYTTGNFEGTVDFNPSSNTNNLTAGNGNSCYISKLDASGNYVWAGVLGGANSDTHAQSIELDAQNNIFAAGYFEGAITDFDPGVGTTTFTPVFTDLFVTKLTSNGDFIWARQIQGAGGDYLGDIDIDADGRIYCTGYFNGVTDFDPSASVQNFTPVSGLDAFLLKLKQDAYLGITEFGNEQAFDIYPNPASDFITIQTEETIESIQIYSSIGEQLISTTATYFSIEELPVGIYFIEINSTKGKIFTRLVKE